jgi:hypothetical protein
MRHVDNWWKTLKFKKPASPTLTPEPQLLAPVRPAITARPDLAAGLPHRPQIDAMRRKQKDRLAAVSPKSDQMF